MFNLKQCSKFKIYLYFESAGQIEANFSKLSQKAKENWQCLKCKSSFAVNETPIGTTPKKIQCLTGTAMLEKYIVSNNVLQDSSNSVKFMNNKFDEFIVQIKDLVSAVKKIKIKKTKSEIGK